MMGPRRSSSEALARNTRPRKLRVERIFILQHLKIDFTIKGREFEEFEGAMI